MGKKKSGTGCSDGMEKVAAPAAREFALKVAMHCRCHGCTDRLRAAVRDLTLAPGVVAVDQPAAEATGDPERLRKSLRKATGKKVDLVFPPNKERKKGEDAQVVDAAAVQALLADLQLHHYGGQAPHQYGGQGAAAAWAANQQHQQQLVGLGGGWNGGVPVAALLVGLILPRRARFCCLGCVRCLRVCSSGPGPRQLLRRQRAGVARPGLLIRARARRVDRVDRASRRRVRRIIPDHRTTMAKMLLFF